MCSVSNSLRAYRYSARRNDESPGCRAGERASSPRVCDQTISLFSSRRTAGCVVVARRGRNHEAGRIGSRVGFGRDVVTECRQNIIRALQGVNLIPKHSEKFRDFSFTLILLTRFTYLRYMIKSLTFRTKSE